MAVYDAVAAEYAGVFNDIRLRCFEWPWLKKAILDLKPRHLLDLGCGNGYLLKALKPIVPNLYAVEPSGPMFRLAREQIGEEAALFEAPAENLPFADGFFDTVVSLLSFRYMDWDKALGEIHRVLKPEGTFILIDLFAARFNLFKLKDYFTTQIKVRLQYAGNRDYRGKLKKLSRNSDWQNMVRENPRRELEDAKRAVLRKFSIQKEKILSLSVRGTIAGLVCGKK